MGLTHLIARAPSRSVSQTPFGVGPCYCTGCDRPVPTQMHGAAVLFVSDARARPLTAPLPYCLVPAPATDDVDEGGQTHVPGHNMRHDLQWQSADLRRRLHVRRLQGHDHQPKQRRVLQVRPDVQRHDGRRQQADLRRRLHVRWLQRHDHQPEQRQVLQVRPDVRRHVGRRQQADLRRRLRVRQLQGHDHQPEQRQVLQDRDHDHGIATNSPCGVNDDRRQVFKLSSARCWCAVGRTLYFRSSSPQCPRAHAEWIRPSGTHTQSVICHVHAKAMRTPLKTFSPFLPAAGTYASTCAVLERNRTATPHHDSTSTNTSTNTSNHTTNDAGTHPGNRTSTHPDTRDVLHVRGAGPGRG